MHPIIPFYAFFMLFALFGFPQADRRQRAILWVAGWGGMLVVLLAITFREIRDDTARYFIRFQSMADQSFREVWDTLSGNVLFDLTQWGFAQIGTHPLWMILPVTLFCILMLRYSLRQILNPYSTAIAILLYSAYPYFIFYVASGIKQGIAMALLMQGYVCFYQKRYTHTAAFICLAALFHNGSLIVLPFLIVHYFIWHPRFGYRRALKVSFGALIFCTLLSISSLNEVILAPLQGYLGLNSRYDVYFIAAREFNYQAGFRIDFTIFSFLPFFAAWWFHRQNRGLRLRYSGWWLNLYALLACIYQLFAFAPFADRFASFGWYLIPAIVVIMLVDCGSQFARRNLVLVSSLLNILILQFYTGNNLHFSF